MLRLEDRERETSLEQLRRIAITQHKAIEQIAEALEHDTVLETAKLHDIDPAAYLVAAARADADGRAPMPRDFAQPPA